MPLVKKTLAPPPQAQDGQQAFAARLQSEKAEDRWEAARQSSEYPEAIGELAALLDREQDERVREAAFTSLARRNNTESFDIILRHLRADDAARRTAALDALKLMPNLVAARLDALLADTDADIRVLVCDLARTVLPSIAQKSLAAILARETSVNVCAAAIDLLAEIGTPEILPDLAACATRLSAPFLNFSIKTATAQIDARSASPQT